MNISSPHISVLDFDVLYNLSGTTPQIQVTNQSVGPNLSAVTWWFVVTGPSGVLHTGSLAIPDRVGVWATWTMVEAWPQSLGHIDWSGIGYTVHLYINDGIQNYDLAYSAPVVPPRGNDGLVKDNFGKAAFLQLVKCNSGQVYAQDQTNYMYQSRAGVVVSEKWTMKYPPNNNGVSTADQIVTGNSYAYFNVNYNANGYKITLETVRDYLVANHSSVRVKFIGQNVFNVQCSMDMCNLLCGYQKMLAKAMCNPCTNDALRLRMTKITAKINLALIGITAGCADVNLAALVKDVKALLGEFDCCCDGNGTNDDIFPSGGATVIVDIIDGNTDVPPVECPNSFYPATVFAPDGVTAIGVATSILSLIAIVNSNAAWQALGKAVYNGTQCTVGFIKNNDDDIIPVIIITKDPTDIIVDIIDGDTGIAPAPCPLAFYPATVFAPDGVTAIGVATSIYHLIAIVNSNPAWQALGVATYIGEECRTGFIPIDPGTIIPDIIIIIVVGTVTLDIIDGCTDEVPVPCPGSFYPCVVRKPDGVTIIGAAGSIFALIGMINADPDWNLIGLATYNGTLCSVGFTPVDPDVTPDIIITFEDCCIDNVQTYVIPLLDLCTGLPITSFPFVAYVDYGAGRINLGSVANMAAYIAALNADVNKPAAVTYSTGTLGTGIDLLYVNTNCTAFSTPVTLSGAKFGANYLLYGANNKRFGLGIGGEYGIGLLTDTVIGRIPTPLSETLNKKWHTTTIANGTIMLIAEGNTGKIYWYNITSPLSPVLMGVTTLTTVHANNFTGVPNYGGQPWFYGLYFPTDYHQMTEQQVYVMESTTGSIWLLNTTFTVVNAWQDNRLRGKCPRVLPALNGKLYFTQDGNIESVTGTSGVLPGKIVLVDTLPAVFSGGGVAAISIVTVDLNPVPVIILAASFDLAGHIWFVGTTFGDPTSRIYKMDIPANTISSTFHVVPHNYYQWVNCKWHSNNRLYISSYEFGTLWVNLTGTPAATAFENLTLPVGTSPNITHWNFLPLAGCAGVLTFSNATAASGIAKFDLDGNYLGLIPFNGEFYNVIAVPNIYPYTPTTLI